MEASALSHPAGLGRFAGPAPLLRLRTDDQLVAVFRAGHDEAFKVIHDRYRQRLLAYARQMLGGARADAEDVLQDVFLRAYHALRVDARPVTLRAWLYRVAHNRCIDQLRRPSPPAADIFDVNRAPQQDPMMAAERREDLRRLIDDVQRLPEQQRSALLMREMEGLTYVELAAALDVTVPAIKSLLVRARIGLVEAIEARDTACTDIRDDLVAAFDRGVRASGRSRKHLRECSSCRDYRSALRGIEKQLNGLAPGAGPLAALAKILGLGGAGSGAAAGGSVAVGVAGGTTATVGTGVATITAGKVAAVVAAAAVVGGGAAKVEQTVKHHRPAPQSAASTPRVIAAGPAAVAPDRVLQRQPMISAPVTRIQRAPAAPRTVAERTDDPPSPLTPQVPVADPAPTYEPTTGGLQAPDEPPVVPQDSTTPAPTTNNSGTNATNTGSSTPTVPGGHPSAGTTNGASSTTATGHDGATSAPVTSGTTTPTAANGEGTTESSGVPVAQGAATTG